MKLKKCPFCGGEAEIKAVSSAVAYMGQIVFHKVGCKKCGIYATENREIEAIERWNRRAEE